MLKYTVSHKSGATGKLGYLEKYGKCKDEKVAANHVFPIASGIFYLGQAVTALHSLHHQ
jgi:hypothetical protein